MVPQGCILQKSLCHVVQVAAPVPNTMWKFTFGCTCGHAGLCRGTGHLCWATGELCLPAEKRNPIWEPTLGLCFQICSNRVIRSRNLKSDTALQKGSSRFSERVFIFHGVIYNAKIGEEGQKSFILTKFS